MTKTLIMLLGCFFVLLEASGRTEKKDDLPSNKGKELKEVYFTYGTPKAPITIIEYSSSACGACRYFKETSWPKIKKHYIDTGKVFWILKPFGFAQVDTFAAQISFCHPNPGDMLETYYKTQERWLGSKDPLKVIQDIAEENGMKKEDLEKCLKNQDILNGLIFTRFKAATFEINATPTFFIGKTCIPEAIDYETFAKILDSALHYVHLGNDFTNFVYEMPLEEKNKKDTTKTLMPAKNE